MNGANGKGKGRAVEGGDGAGEEEDGERDEERESFAPGQDADYFVEEDADGRFL